VIRSSLFELWDGPCRPSGLLKGFRISKPRCMTGTCSITTKSNLKVLFLFKPRSQGP
jgi:hypothetical protein